MIFSSSSAFPRPSLLQSCPQRESPARTPAINRRAHHRLRRFQRRSTPDGNPRSPRWRSRSSPGVHDEPHGLIEWLPFTAQLIGIDYLKIVPTTDPNITFGMSLSVFALIIYYSFTKKGAGGFLAELTLHPLNPKELGVPKILWPLVIAFNFILESVAMLAKPLSLSCGFATCTPTLMFI